MNVARSRLTDHARDTLRRTDPPAALLREIERGDVELWCIDAGRAYVATEPDGGTLWVHALAGRDTADVIRRIFRKAAANGFCAVSAYTRKPGMARLLRRHGMFCAGWADGRALVTKITQGVPDGFQ